MTDIGSALRDLAPDRPAPAGLAERVRERVRRGRRRRRTLTAVGVVAVVALVGVGIGVATGDRPTTVTVVAVPSRSATPSAAPASASPTPSISPGAVPLAGGPSTFVGISDGQLFRYDATTGRRLAALSPRLPGRARSVASLPDGSFVVATDVLGRCASRLSTVRFGGGAPRVAALGPMLTGQVHAIAVAADGRLALSAATTVAAPQDGGGCGQDALLLTDAQGRVQRTWQGPAAGHPDNPPNTDSIGSLAWLPAGTSLAVESGECCSGVYGFAVLDVRRPGSRYPLAPDRDPKDPCYTLVVAGGGRRPLLGLDTCTAAADRTVTRVDRLVVTAGQTARAPVADAPQAADFLASDAAGSHLLLLADIMTTVTAPADGRALYRVDGAIVTGVAVRDRLDAAAW